MKRRIFLPWTFMLPIAALLLMFSLFVAEQLYCGWAYRETIASFRRDGQPVDKRSLDAWVFMSHSHSQTTKRQALAACYDVSFFLSPDYDAGMPNKMRERFLKSDLYKPGSDWPDQQAIRKFVEENRYLLNELDRLSVNSEPTWRPTNPWVYHSGWQISLCDAEFSLAFYDNDPKRAFKALTLFHSELIANDIRVDTSQDRVQIQHETQLFKRMMQSLETPDFWSDEQLVALSSLIKARTPLKERWRKAITGDRARKLEFLNKDSGWLWSFLPNRYFRQGRSGVDNECILNSEKYQLLQSYNRAMALADGGYTGLQLRASLNMPYQRSDLRGWFSLYPQPPAGNQNSSDPIRRFRLNTEYYANLLVDYENIRRLADVGIALRKYCNQHDKWPTDMTDLIMFGIDSTEPRDVDEQIWKSSIGQDDSIELAYRYQQLDTGELVLRLRPQ